MAPKDVKEDRKYTKDHEWAKLESGEVRIGITAFAVDQLGDVTLVSLDVGPGSQVKAAEPFGTIESVKTLSDLYAPISGTIVAVNSALEDKPELINEDCYGSGWMVVIKCDDEAAFEELMTSDAYLSHVDGLDH